MRRREFLRDLAAGAAGLGVGASVASAAQAKPRTRFLLSKNGCGRATGYAEANKIVTVDGKTHVAWIDSVAEGFRIRVRTLDRATGTWSPTYTVGEAHDNHGGPALAVDSKGHLHIVYYPHHHPFRYRRSSRPNDASQWDREIRFGQRCTYPTLMVGPDDTLYLTCRESNRKGKPWVVNLYTKKPDGDWQRPTAILRADEPNYAHFQEALAWGPDHRTLHLSARMYGGKPGRSYPVRYLRSRDFGRTWERADGGRVELPGTSKTISIIPSDRTKQEGGFRCGSIAVDAAGTPHVLYSESARQPSEAWIATPDKSGQWRKRPLLADVTRTLPDWCVSMTGGMTFGAGGWIFVVLEAVPFKPGTDTRPAGWGDTRKEIVWLESTDGGKHFTATMASTPDPTCTHWLPSLERPTGHNRVSVPGLIYTAGGPGKKNTDILSNGVWWVGPPIGE